MKRSLYLAFLLLAGTMNGQGIPDLLHNKQYEFQNRQIKPALDKPWIRNEIDFNCYYFENDVPAGHKKLNNGMVALSTAQLETEDRFIKLEREAVLRLEVYSEIQNSSNQGGNGIPGRPRLVHVACEVISIAAGKAMIEMAYRFEFSTSGRSSGDVNVRHYYLGDLASGNIASWKPAVATSNIAALRGLIKDTFNQQYLYGTQKMAYDERGSFAVAEAAVGDTFEKIDLRYADFYWYRSGVMVQFQECAPGTQVFGGRFFRLFFPYEKALAITKLFPEFAYINNLPKIKHNFRDTSQDAVFAKMNKLRQPPAAESFANGYKGPKPVRSLIISNIQIADDGSPYPLGTQKFTFNTDGTVASSVFHNENGQAGTEMTYSYDAAGRLVEAGTLDQWKRTGIRRYIYDSNGNSIGSVFNDGFDEAEEWSYFYNGNHAYGYTHSLFHNNRTDYYIHHYELEEGKLCLYESCYALNAQGEIAGLLSAGGRVSQQLGFDERGRLVESHFDNDRDNYYFYYDAEGRYSKMQMYEFTTKKQEYNFYYDGDSPLPMKISKNAFGTSTEQILTWEFYD